MSTSPRGLFVSFEGIDGAGKSTHIEGLARLFTQHGRRVTLTREPGGTPLAETLRGLVLNESMDPLTEALLVFAARRDHLHHVIELRRRSGLLPLLERAHHARGQVFMTCTEENWPRELSRDLHRWEIRSGSLNRRA